MIKVTFQCDGCDASESECLEREFVSLTGRPWGFGSYREKSVREVTPKGWIAFDRYTGCTYCPACWEEIIAGLEDTSPQSES